MTNSVLIGDARYPLTPWFPVTAVPDQVGVYERESSGGAVYACWDGHAWRHDADTAEAASRIDEPASRESRRWRGLAEPTDAPCSTCGGHTVTDAGVDVEAGADLISECPDC